MRPWRDVYSVPDWQRITQTVFKGTTDKNIATLTHQIKSYHAVDKEDKQKLDTRISLLKQIHLTALDYLRASELVKKKPKNTPVDDHVKQVRAKEQGPRGQIPSDESPFKTKTRDGVIWVLSRRAGRKIQYLLQLQKYYHDEHGPLVHPTSLLELLSAPESRENGLLGVCNSVLLEKLDPYHRTFDVAITSTTATANADAISLAFRDWVGAYRGMKTKAPFFLWLESHPLCTAGGRDSFSTELELGIPESVQAFGPKDVHSVRYETEKVGLLLAKGGLLFQWMNDELDDWLLVGSRDDTGEPFDTARFKCREGDGFAAFVWTKDSELLVAPHLPGTFHHSSFVSGDVVRCAGMIKVVHGKVTAVSNNSGHYKPTGGHLEVFVQHLRELGVVDPEVKVITVGG